MVGKKDALSPNHPEEKLCSSLVEPWIFQLIVVCPIELYFLQQIEKMRIFLGKWLKKPTLNSNQRVGRLRYGDGVLRFIILVLYLIFIDFASLLFGPTIGILVYNFVCRLRTPFPLPSNPYLTRPPLHTPPISTTTTPFVLPLPPPLHHSRPPPPCTVQINCN